jgi:hypothetical protein
MLNDRTPAPNPIIRYVFDASIAATCLTIIGLALCAPL